ncbi:hypothetical protein F8568_001335 [Actinomadura sp. LD22]|uniref:Outer membrane channel protein CpnT-like N-terminal domain-containing protein n=1 Tax=Actinomadura physcomitrii TaxID=2650748 RepID=A0A6I4M5D4_9ACTN|nr:hypothetical protein [Actinomadura physcomitrii]MVZ99050.1 hypothetical protein [Actinomadura physcomitrii]
MSPPPVPATSVPARVDITPETVDRAAANFAIGQQDLIKAYTTLSQKLSAHSSGMAGFDKAAHQFAALYDPAAKAAYQAFHKAIEALGGTSLGLSQTVNNHLAADHHSRADRPGGAPPRFPPHPVTQNFAVAAAPPSVIGAMSWAPNTTVPLLRRAVPHLPGWVDGLLGTSNDWPQGNPDMFDQTGDAWADAAREIGQVGSWLNWTITTILDPADNAEHTTVATYWATLYRPGDTSTIVPGLQAMCTALANACHEYAQATRDATRIVTGEHIAEIILLLGAGAVTGLLRKLFGRILSRVGAYMLGRVAAIAERWALRRILADLLKATADTRVVKAVQGAFDKTVGKALGKDIEATERRLGLVPGTPEYEARLTELAKDPAHGGKPNAATRREAEVGLQLERDGLLPGPIKRAPFDEAGNDRGEFIDAAGRHWDVKSSPDVKPSYNKNPGQPIPRPQSAELFTAMVNKELDKGINVIIDPIGMTAERVSAMKQVVAAHPEWQGKVIWKP